MLRLIRALVRSTGPPLLLVLLLVFIAGLFVSTAATNGVEPAPPIGVVLILASTGAFVMKRVPLPDFMAATPKNKRSPRSGVVPGRKVRSSGSPSRYSRPRLMLTG